MQLDDALTSRDTINAKLRDILDDATDKWGTRVVRVEIQRIDPPPDIVALDAPADAGRADPARRRDRGAGCPGSRDHTRRRREAGGDPRGRRAPRSGRSSRPRVRPRRSNGSPTAERTREIAVAEGEAQAIRDVLRRDPRRRPDARTCIAIKYLEALARRRRRAAPRRSSCPSEMGGLFGRSAARRAPAVSRSPTAPPRTSPVPSDGPAA